MQADPGGYAPGNDKSKGNHKAPERHRIGECLVFLVLLGGSTPESTACNMPDVLAGRPQHDGHVSQVAADLLIAGEGLGATGAADQSRQAVGGASQPLKIGRGG